MAHGIAAGVVRQQLLADRGVSQGVAGIHGISVLH
jgi:hypothetical protein